MGIPRLKPTSSFRDFAGISNIQQAFPLPFKESFGVRQINVATISNEVGSVKNVFVLVFGCPVHTRWVCAAALG